MDIRLRRKWKVVKVASQTHQTPTLRSSTESEKRKEEREHCNQEVLKAKNGWVVE